MKKRGLFIITIKVLIVVLPVKTIINPGYLGRKKVNFYLKQKTPSGRRCHQFYSY